MGTTLTPKKLTRRSVSCGGRRDPNPLLAPWSGPYKLPPFGKFEMRHFKLALEAGLREHAAEIKKISLNPVKPTFANTIVALEKSGRLISRVASLFGNLEATDSTPDLQALAREMALAQIPNPGLGQLPLWTIVC